MLIINDIFVIVKIKMCLNFEKMYFFALKKT